MFRAGLIVLTVSLTANLYLWCTSTSPSSKRSEARHERQVRMLRLPKPTVVSDAPDLPLPQNESRDALEQRLLRISKRIDELVPAKERFDAHARSLDSENVARSYLDQVFGARVDPSHPYSVECHGSTCKLQTDRPIQEWQHTLQTSYPEAALFCRMSFSDEVYLDLCDPEVLAARFMDGIRLAFFAADGTSACAAKSTSSGDLTFSVSFDERQRRFYSSLSGSLASEEVGACLHDVLERLLAGTNVPASIPSLPDSSFDVQLPLRAH